MLEKRQRIIKVKRFLKTLTIDKLKLWLHYMEGFNHFKIYMPTYGTQVQLRKLIETEIKDRIYG